MFQSLSPESQGRDLALTALYVPYSLDSSTGVVVDDCRRSPCRTEVLDVLESFQLVYPLELLEVLER